MEYQKIINLLHSAANQPSKFRIKNGLKRMVMWVEHTTQTVKSSSRLQC